MRGLDAETGRSLDGWEHVVQSIRDILTTRYGERVQREWYGSLLPEILGENLTPDVILPAIASIAVALEGFEPRVRLLDTQIDAAPRAGRIGVTLVLAYRPRALLGDYTEEPGQRTIAF